jgi:peptidoglycan/LPS O-acetylase OafA/YrhL
MAAAGRPHPSRGEVFGFARVSREDIDPVLLAVAALAVLPVGLYVLGQLNLQATLDDSHVALIHYSTMGYFSLGAVGLALLAAVRTRGRRFPAYAAAVMALGLAAASVFYPTASGLDALWSGLATIWALALVGAYEWSIYRRGTVRADRTGEEQEPAAAD